MTDGATGRSSLYADPAYVVTGGTAASPAFFSFGDVLPSPNTLIMYFAGRPAGPPFTAWSICGWWGAMC
jgi:hypothetical protein